VRQRERLDRVMKEHGIEVVFHAAAYKHVPIIEAQPEEGVATNVFGTKEVLNSAIEHGVSDFVLISTDKAVRPTNAMGATKRIAELVLQAAARESHHTRISMVRGGRAAGVLTDAHAETSIDKVFTADEPWVAPEPLERALNHIRGLLDCGDAVAIKRELLALVGSANGSTTATSSSVSVHSTVVSRGEREEQTASAVI